MFELKRANEHDPLCHAAKFDYRDAECCDCDLIAKVEKREREKIAQAIYAMRNRWLDNFDKGVTGADQIAVLSAFDAAVRIARSGGNGE